MHDYDRARITEEGQRGFAIDTRTQASMQWNAFGPRMEVAFYKTRSSAKQALFTRVVCKIRYENRRIKLLKEAQNSIPM
jgi:hypothetical protein